MSLSSAKVSGGHRSVLYENINYKGAKWILKPGKYANFIKKKLSKNRSWNDVVFSLCIR
ncbi:beta/gamma crystallin-related protein [Shimazuella alba]|uniref:beta/gamma crystallin-related protein n=1 Tax=Shimazuella alba TaxID=2690964 RepID=UPI003B838CB7